jgi:hypothetical protein
MELQPVQRKPFFERNSVKYGLLAGAVGALIMILFYVIDEHLFIDFLFGFAPLVAVLIICIIAAVKERSDRGGYIDFGGAVGTSFVAIVFAALVFLIIELILNLVVDPDLQRRIQELQLEQFENWVNKGWMTESRLEAYKQQMESFPPGPGLVIFNAIGKVILFPLIGVIVFLISSIFIRKEKDTI